MSVYDYLIAQVQEAETTIQEEITDLQYCSSGKIFETKEEYEIALKQGQQEHNNLPHLSVLAPNETLVSDPQPLTLEAYFSPRTEPLKLMEKGSPHPLTLLATQSSLTQALQQEPLAGVKLFTHTSFRLQLGDRHLCLMSDLEACLQFWEKYREQEANVAGLMYWRFFVPCLHLMKINNRRRQEGQPLLRRVIIHDLNLRFGNRFNHCFAATVWGIMKKFSGYLNEIVVVTERFATRYHLTHFINYKKTQPVITNEEETNEEKTLP